MKENMKAAVLRVVNEHADALEAKEVYRQVQAESREQFDSTVQALTNDGSLIVTKRGKLISPKSSGLVPAKIVSQSKGFAFARPLSGGEDVYVPAERMKGAMLGDMVMLHQVRQAAKGPEGAVERVVVKGSRTITGTVLRSRSGCELRPDSAFRFCIEIERGAAMGARDGDKVLAVLSKKQRRVLPTARVLKIYGKASSAKICADAVIDANKIPREFSPQAMEEARRLQARGILPQELQGRLDLRNAAIFTIDGADAKDLDDAVSVEKMENGWKLGVHIADVSHYVREGGPIDTDARLRGTSVYFADRVVPMLPEALSNGLCSLNAGEDKLAFSAMMELDAQGELRHYTFSKSVIRSKVRGVYSEVNQIFNHTAGEELTEKYRPVYQSLLQAQELANLLKERAAQRGTMDLESGECRFVLNEEGVCIDVLPRVQGEAEQMIEQFMIMANQAAARLARRAELPFVYRVHESPDPDRVQTLRELAGVLGLPNAKLKEGVQAADFARLLDAARDTPAELVISHQVLRTMAKARYDYRPLGHFGLCLVDYCHFTSPIRRYPDTAIHRILTDYVSGQNKEQLQKKYTEFAASAASFSSEYEVRAMRAERDAEKCYMAEYMTQHVGETFEGVISGVTGRGIFVALPNGVEGFVSLDHFPECRFRFDGLTAHTDEITGMRLAIGGKLRIQVQSADVATGLIDFLPAE